MTTSSMAGDVTSSDFHFYTNVRAYSFNVLSDSRYKTDVQPLGEAADMISLLTPVSYSLTAPAEPASKTKRLSEEGAADEDFQPLEPDNRRRYGFIAQEVRELFPELVTEDEEGVLAIDYMGFIPLLVDALNSLQATVEEQARELEALRKGERMNAPASAHAALLEAGASLAQNSPNPFSETTVIACNVPEGISQADIFVYNLQGQQSLRLAVSGRGDTSVTLDARSLQPGMYIYSLVADGVEVESRRMIITD